MNQSARGQFEVTSQRHPPYDSGEGVTLARVTFQKRFRGELEGTSTVEMIGAVTAVQGSAGYVAIERVRGSLHGRSGSFVLQHSGTMRRGTQALSVSVVPDSGSGELQGLRGQMQIEIVEGQHQYRFDYSLEV
jgi:Protein of unknown function (DUF3224)